MKRIDSLKDLHALTRELGVAGDWHESDAVEVTAEVHGTIFDNAGSWPGLGAFDKDAEMHVILKREGEPVAAVNLATLFAWATGYKGWEDE